jgi:hypothetical protein
MKLTIWRMPESATCNHVDTETVNVIGYRLADGGFRGNCIIGHHCASPNVSVL